MTEAECLLVCLAEECAEVAQRVSKALRFGLEEVQPGQDLTNGQRLLYEYNDLLAVVSFLREYHVLQPEHSWEVESRKAKRVKLLQYLNYSKAVGTVDK